ncbi:hypothetical protein M2454_001897 [Aequitasia blattaphilus]|uniref:Polymorphic toxin type 50 domain-containing protein n=1 Tax=Aequitasia blattaphilus TaxID=2949332 RepID=A0ABT1E9T7_9FIRM|nr:phage minor capsid protein [Aequitasia blattaphilus]MCP1102585.1 polymorphic toxin type 50 domain-containing protein [Aequitasia blattaphilus]MCR8615225.1 polymorphic toxin type 50 domain-containing protein [Aequitasia blattaphilus]
MKITPHQMDIWTWQMAELYESLTGEIIRLIVERLNNDHTDIREWHAKALKDLHLFNKDVAKEIAKVTDIAEEEINRMFEVAGHSFVVEIDSSMPYDNQPYPNNVDQVMRGYAKQCWSEINNYVNQTLISTNYEYGSTATKAYTGVLNRTQAAFNTGMYTRTEALERAVVELAQKGIRSTFIDKGGHAWSLERYVQTVLDSTLANTYNTIRTERMADYGVHTVVVTSHMGARLACSLIQGNVVDIRPIEQLPEGSEYRSLYDPYWGADYGAPGGHRGCNCQHAWIPFIPGVNTNNQPKYDLKENAEVAKKRTEQRRLERRLIDLKKRKMVADEMGDKESVKRWNKSIKATNNRMRELVESNKWLYRDLSREKVFTPLDLLVKDHENSAIMRTKINPEKFNRHIQGTKEYEDYFEKKTKAGGAPGYLTISQEKAQILIDTHVALQNATKQRIKADFAEEIGYYVDQKTNKAYKTTRGTIHLSKTGCHIAPTRQKDWRE